VVFDLWTGRWEVLDAAKRGVPQARWGSGGKPCASQAAQSCAGRGHAACRAHAVQRPFLAPLKACPRRRRPALRAPPPPQVLMVLPVALTCLLGPSGLLLYLLAIRPFFRPKPAAAGAKRE
jgi:hypothetical protein